MRTTLEDRFPEELALLSRLFGESVIAARLPRLDAVSEYTEQKWLEYIGRIPDGHVNYLLIAEAPPETADNPPLYFLDPACKPRTLMRAVHSAFFGPEPIDCARTLDRLAQRGFLMIDSIPFAMKYKSLRRRATYSRIVARTAKTYMIAKLSSSSLSWSDELRIAFSVPLNGHCVMTALQNVLRLDGQDFRLSNGMIATDASNYPRGNKLREAFHLKPEARRG